MKKGMFYTVDAWIALSIIVVVVIAALVTVRNSEQETKIHEDILTTLSEIKIGEANIPYAQSLISQGYITDLNKSLLEQIGEFYVTDQEKAVLLAQAAIENIDTKNVGIWYGSTLLASNNDTSINSAKKVQIARQIITGVREGSNITGYSARAQLSSSARTKYFYFGGYVGDGNLTAQVKYDGSITKAEIEIATNNDFEVYINNVLSGSFTKSPSTTTPARYTLPTTNFLSGNNKIDIRGNNIYIAGGFIKISYLSNSSVTQDKYFIPGINGTVNLYDSITSPGQLQKLEISIDLNSNYITNIILGNKTLWRNFTSGKQNIFFSNSNLSSMFDYNTLSNKTTPFRIYIENTTFSTNGTTDADVILITDVSGSMDWRLDSDTTGNTITNCSSPSLYNPSTKRISLAKCLDKQFIDIILNGTNNRVGLVSFSSSATQYIDLTTDSATLKTQVDNYVTGGATCVSCAINLAKERMQAQSSSGRNKFIIVMTDGVTNVRSTETCNDLLGASATTNTLLASGISGRTIKKSNNQWLNISSTANQINDIDLLNDTFGFAVGASGTILSWNGSTWTQVTSPVATNLLGVDVLNRTYALAVGSSGRVLKWNGSTWSISATISNSPTLNSVSTINSTLAFIAGSRSNQGRIYKSTTSATTWTEDLVYSTNLRGIKILNNTLAYAVGNAGNGARWLSGTWSASNTQTGETLYKIENLNSTNAYAVGGDNGHSIITRLNGGTWTKVLDVSGDSLRDIIVLNNTFIAIGEGSIIFESTSGTSWTQNFDIPDAYSGTSPTGVSCTADQDSCSETNSFPSLNANYSSCLARATTNSTVHSIGFGPIASCSFATQTLQNIANCGNGTFYSSSNASALQQIYVSIANNILQASYNEQTITANNTATTLYPESYINITYTTQQNPYGLIITSEKIFTNTSAGIFTIPSDGVFLEGRAISYSGPRWTEKVRLNAQEVFNINNFGTDYVKIGDPYSIIIPKSLTNSSNVVEITTAISPQNSSSGSASNKIIYTIARNVSGYSPIAARIDGCVWYIEFDDSTNATIRAPSNFTGSSACSYAPSSVIYDQNDAAQYAIYNLLKKLDLNNDFKVDSKFAEQDLEFSLSEVQGIPYTWSTEVQIRAWY